MKNIFAFVLAALILAFAACDADRSSGEQNEALLRMDKEELYKTSKFCLLELSSDSGLQGQRSLGLPKNLKFCRWSDQRDGVQFYTYTQRPFCKELKTREHIGDYQIERKVYSDGRGIFGRGCGSMGMKIGSDFRSYPRYQELLSNKSVGRICLTTGDAGLGYLASGDFQDVKHSGGVPIIDMYGYDAYAELFVETAYNPWEKNWSEKLNEWVRSEAGQDLRLITCRD